MFKNQKGFTLLELIVVITIISILSLAVGQNIINKTGESRVSTHRQNIAQIEKAAQLYILDNETLDWGVVDDTNRLISEGYLKTDGVIENPWSGVDDAIKAGCQYAIVDAGALGPRVFLVAAATTIDTTTGAVTSALPLDYVDENGTLNTVADPTAVNISQ